MEQIENKAEDSKANASNNSDEIESLKFEMKEQSDKISKQCWNQALKHQHEMKEEDPSIQGYIRYPATLMLKYMVKKSIRLKRKFLTSFCVDTPFWFHFFYVLIAHVYVGCMDIIDM